MRRQRGFSLIELLIVVAIILIIAAIAIPNLLKSRIAANEASAVGSIRTLITAEWTYSMTNPQTGFTTLQNLGTAGLIDPVLAGGTKSGYSVSATLGDPTSLGTSMTFVILANPVTPGTTGNRYFCATESGMLKFSMTSIADHTACESSMGLR